MNTTLIPFSIAQYQKLVVEDKTHEVVCRNGTTARVLCTDNGDLQPVIAIIVSRKDGRQHCGMYGPEGSYFNYSSTNEHDLFIRATGTVARPVYRSFDGTLTLTPNDLFVLVGYLQLLPEKGTKQADS